MDEDEAGVNLRALNDRARRRFTGCIMDLTAGMYELSLSIRSRVLTRVRSYDEFAKANDPFEEHGFGSFKVNGGVLLGVRVPRRIRARLVRPGSPRSRPAFSPSAR
jgi:hypothetical protein